MTTQLDPPASLAVAGADSIEWANGTRVGFSDGRTAQCATAGLWCQVLGHSGLDAASIIGHGGHDPTGALRELDPSFPGLAATGNRAETGLALDGLLRRSASTSDGTRSPVVRRLHPPSLPVQPGSVAAMLTDRNVIVEDFDDGPLSDAEFLLVEPAGRWGTALLEIDTIRHGIEQARRDDVFVLVDEIGSSVLRNQGLGRRNSGGLGDVVGDVVVYGPELTNGTFETHFLSMAPERAQLVHNRHTVTDSEVKAVVVMLTVIRSAEFQDNQRLIGNLLAKGMRFLLDEGLVTSASGRGLSWTLSPAPGTTGRTPQGGLAMSERFRRQQVWLPVDDIGRVYVLPAAISTPGDVARLLDGLHAGLSGDDAPAQADVGWR